MRFYLSTMDLRKLRDRCHSQTPPPPLLSHLLLSQEKYPSCRYIRAKRLWECCIVQTGLGWTPSCFLGPPVVRLQRAPSAMQLDPGLLPFGLRAMFLCTAAAHMKLLIWHAALPACSQEKTGETLVCCSRRQKLPWVVWEAEGKPMPAAIRLQALFGNADVATSSPPASRLTDVVIWHAALQSSALTRPLLPASPSARAPGRDRMAGLVYMDGMETTRSQRVQMEHSGWLSSGACPYHAWAL